MVRHAQQCDYTSCYWTGLLNIVKMGCFILCDFYHNKKQKIKILLRTLKKKKKRRVGDREIFHSVGKVHQALEEGTCSIG